MGQLVWAIELLVDFAYWRDLTKNPDNEDERLRWVKMCHRLGSTQAWRIVNGRHRLVDTMSNQNRRRKRRSTGA